MRRIGLLGLSVLLAAGLAGCSGAGTDPSPSPAPTTSLTSTPLPVPPDFGETNAGVAADVTITECPLATGEVVAKGTAVNSASEPRDIAIIIVWLKNDSGSPLGSGMTVLEQVPAGETVDWEVSGVTVDLPERCVLNATAGQQQD